MYKEVEISELAKDTRNTVAIKMPDGKIFEISYLPILVSEKYKDLIEDTTQTVKDLIRTDAITDLVKKETDVKKIKSYQKELEEIHKKNNGNGDRYWKRLFSIIKALVLKNGYTYEKKYWVEFSADDIMSFIRASIEKDIDPSKKKELKQNLRTA